MVTTPISCTRDYVAWTETVAVYDKKGTMTDSEKKQYLVLGLIDEIGELAGMFKRNIRDGDEIIREELKLELGDAAWYLARLHYDHLGEVDTEHPLYGVAKELGLVGNSELGKGSCFDDAIIIMERIKGFIKDKQAAVNFVSKRPSDFMRNSLIEVLEDLTRALESLEQDLNAFVINMANRVITASPAALFRNIVDEATSNEALLSWCCLCYKFDFEIMDVLTANVNKLESRKERGTLHGKGSER